MREDKYKAWNGKEMSSNALTVSELYEADSYADPRKLTWLKYSGVKDMNGIEIYEGDILLNPYGNRMEVFYAQEAPNSAYYWGCHEEGVGVKRLRDTVYGFSEIIGNIYENGHLRWKQLSLFLPCL